MSTISMQEALHYSTYMSSITALLTFLHVGVSDTESPLSKEAIHADCFQPLLQGGEGKNVHVLWVCMWCMWWAIIISGRLLQSVVGLW